MSRQSKKGLPSSAGSPAKNDLLELDIDIYNEQSVKERPSKQRWEPSNNDLLELDIDIYNEQSVKERPPTQCWDGGKIWPSAVRRANK